MRKIFKGIVFTLICMFGVLESEAQMDCSKVWARTSTGPNGAAYGTFKCLEGDRLIGAESPVCDHVELHTHIHDGAIKRMRQVEAIDVPTQEKPVVLKPGGLHIMLMGLKTPLAEGDQVPLKLTFEKAGTIDLMAPVKRKGPCCGGLVKPTAGHKVGGAVCSKCQSGQCADGKCKKGCCKQGNCAQKKSQNYAAKRKADGSSVRGAA